MEPTWRAAGTSGAGSWSTLAPRGASRNPQRVPVSPGTCPGQGAVGPGQPPQRLRKTRVQPSVHRSKAFPGSGQTWLGIKSQKGQANPPFGQLPSRTKTDSKADSQNAVSRMSDPQLPDVLKSQPQARAPGGTAPVQGATRAARHGGRYGCDPAWRGVLEAEAARRAGRRGLLLPEGCHRAGGASGGWQGRT